jgi:hypothetical protein
MLTVTTSVCVLPCAGAAAAAAAHSVKVIAQTEAMRGLHRPLSQIARDILEKEGIAAFWKGNGATVVRIIPNKGTRYAHTR